MPNNPEPDALRNAPVAYRPPAATQRLIDELYREEVIEARAMTAEEKLLAGEDLFESACRITLAGIRNQFPEADEAERWRILETRLAWRTKQEETQ
jgi:hypothetical protein